MATPDRQDGIFDETPDVRYSLERKVGLLFALVAAITVAVGAMTYRVVGESANDDRWVEHTHQVLRRLDLLSSLVSAAESGSRAHAITGDDPVLGPLRQARPQ